MLKPLSTNDGQNRKGDVYLLLAFIQPIVYSMAPGWGQVIVGSVALLILAFLSYKTVGNIPPAQAEIVKRKIDEDEIVRRNLEDIDAAEGEDLLNRGRG